MAIIVAICGLIFGAIAGALLGIAVGYGWVAITDPNCFGAACGNPVLVFSLPIGLVAGAVAGASGLAAIVARNRAQSSGSR